MKLFTYKLPFFGRIEAIDLIAICEDLLLSRGQSLRIENTEVQEEEEGPTMMIMMR
jgi:hypothetical protein